MLKEILPVFKAAAPSSSILPLARRPGWNDGSNPMLDSSPILEAEANPRVPELDAEAPGPHILEIETVVHICEVETVEPVSEIETLERALELEAQGPIVELEGSTVR